MLKILEQYLLLFTIYAFLGWLVESIKTFLHTQKFINRGFLIGPYCPIYGFGAVLITLLIKDTTNLLVIFSLSLILCGLVEYFTSYLMEKLFKSRWWDYHYKKFNVNGRICLEYLFYFGIGGLLIIKVFNPIIFNYLNLLSNYWLHIISVILIVNYLIDLKWSSEIATHLQKISKNKQDITEIDANLKRVIIQKYRRHNRLIKAFPLIKDQIGEALDQYFSNR